MLEEFILRWWNRFLKSNTNLTIPLCFLKTFADKLLRPFTSVTNQDTVIVPELGLPSSPTPLLSKEEQEMTPIATPSTEPDLRLRIGVSPEDVGVSDDLAEGNGEAPGYMPGRDLEEDEQLEGEGLCSGEAPSGYEKRPVLVELAPGELTEGYREGGIWTVTHGMFDIRSNEAAVACD